MALQYSTTLRDNQLGQIEATISTSPKLQIYAGTKPGDCATSDGANTLLAEMTLPSDWMGTASGGSVAKSGTWEDTSANATGTAAYFRIKDSTGTTCHVQGTVTATGGGGDLTLDNISINSGQQITITSFTISAGNA